MLLKNPLFIVYSSGCPWTKYEIQMQTNEREDTGLFLWFHLQLVDYSGNLGTGGHGFIIYIYKL